MRPSPTPLNPSCRSACSLTSWSARREAFSPAAGHCEAVSTWLSLDWESPQRAILSALSSQGISEPFRNAVGGDSPESNVGFSDKRVYREKGNVSVTDREEKIGLMCIAKP